MPVLRLILAPAALAMGQAAPAPDASRPAPTFDSVPPQVPALKRPAVLIFSKTNSFRHASIPAAVRAIADLAHARGWRSYATENAPNSSPVST